MRLCHLGTLFHTQVAETVTAVRRPWVEKSHSAPLQCWRIWSFDGFDSLDFGVELNMCSTFEVSYRSPTDIFEFWVSVSLKNYKCDKQRHLVNVTK